MRACVNSVHSSVCQSYNVCVRLRARMRESLALLVGACAHPAWALSPSCSACCPGGL